MDRYICENVFVPLRSGPSHKSEMLSQLLFGEKYFIIDKADHWIKVETVFDCYRGWTDADHLQLTPDKGAEKSEVLNRALLCFKKDGSKIVLEAGCEIYNTDYKNNTFSIGESNYRTCADFSKAYTEKETSFPDTGLKFLNSPYIWGGRIPSGIDCSGFTQLVYKISGIPIPRDSWQQAEAGIAVSFLEETKPGDLVFFDNELGRITHVGMILSRGLVIHASGRVRVDRIDHQGIFKQEIGGYSHKLRTIRRIVI
jgi:cell wall-associated NlpC family hydrolase